MSENTVITPKVEEKPTAEDTFRPLADILELADEFRIEVELPGVAKDGVEVAFHDGRLEIEGRVEPRRRAETCDLLREYGVGSFARKIKVGETIAADEITAEFRDGVLTLRLPKAAAVKARKIDVR